MKKLFLILIFLFFSSYCFANNITIYKSNYFICGDSEDQAKLQISFKYQILDNKNIFISYSQYLFWHVYTKSQPIREINYNPELFYRNTSWISFLTYTQYGYEHMSNGEGLGGQSRGFERIYFQTEKQLNFYNITFGLNLKLFYIFAESRGSYKAYSKYYEANSFLDFKDNKFLVTCGGFNKGYIELKFISYKLFNINPRLCLQYRYGYLENLLTCREKEERFRIGILLK